MKSINIMYLKPISFIGILAYISLADACANFTIELDSTNGAIKQGYLSDGIGSPPHWLDTHAFYHFSTRLTDSRFMVEDKNLKHFCTFSSVSGSSTQGNGPSSFTSWSKATLASASPYPTAPCGVTNMVLQTSDWSLEYDDAAGRWRLDAQWLEGGDDDHIVGIGYCAGPNPY